MSNDKPVTLFTDGALDMQKVDTLLSLGLQKAIEHLKQAVVGFQQELGEKYPHPTERLVLMDAFAQAARLCVEGTEIALNERS